MATDAGEIQVTLTVKAEDFKKAMDGSKKKLEDFGKSSQSFFTAKTVAIGAAMVAVTKFVKDSVAAYGQQEMAEARLTQALVNQGLAVDSLLPKYSAMASELQQLTGVGDETIMSAQALLTTFGVQGNQMEAITKAALDMSVAMGVDLKAATQLLGKAFVGETGMLSRYGIVIDENIPKSEKFAAALAQIQQRFGGTAAAQAKTFSGQMQILAANFSDLQEEIGKLISGPGTGMTKWLNDAVLYWGGMLRTVNETITAFAGLGNVFQMIVIGALRDFLNALTFVGVQLTRIIGLLPGHATLMEVLRRKIEEGNAALQKRIDLTEQEIEGVAFAQAAAIAAEETKVTAKQAAAVKEVAIIDGLSTYTQDMMEKEMKARSKAAEEKVKIQREWYDLFTTTELEMNQLAIRETEKVFDTLGSGVAESIVDGKKFGDVWKKIWQDMARAAIKAITEIMIKMAALAAMKAATGGVGGGFVGGFMAQGGVIAEPSVITGLKSGVSHIAGEAGPEAVVPMRNKTAAEVGGIGLSGGGGGSITINITGQFIEGSEAAWQRMMREKIVPEIRRFTMSTPVGPFNRRRGIS